MITSRVFFTGASIALFAACGGSNTEGPAQPAAPTAATAAPTTVAAPAPSEATTASAPAPQKTLAQKMEDTSKAIVDAWNAHDADKVAAGYAENGSLRLVALTELSGRQAIKAHAADTFKAFPDFKVTVTRVITKGSVAVIEWVITGTNTGDSEQMKIKATKRPIGIHGADFAVYDDAGLVKEARRYYDVPTQMMQLDPKAKAGTFRPVEQAPTTAPVVLVSKGTPEEQKNLDVAKAQQAAWNAHKAADVVGFIAPDLILNDYTEAAPAKASGAKAMLEAAYKAIPDAKVENSSAIAAGDFVAGENHLQGTLKGNLGPLKATNKKIEFHSLDIGQVKDGRFVASWSYGNGMEYAPPAK